MWAVMVATVAVEAPSAGFFAGRSYANPANRTLLGVI
jgi:hypothetical protein